MTLFALRKKWLALVLSLIMPGFGHIYCGELLRGCCLFVFFVFSPLLLTGLVVRMPDSLMLGGTLLALAMALVVYLIGAVDAWRLAGTKGKHYQLMPYNNLAFYLAAWLVGLTLMLACDQYLKSTTMEAYRIVGNSMAPTVLRGDYVLAKKPAFRNRAIKKGDIVIAVYPDDRSKVLIRQIHALPGEMVDSTDGRQSVVPHGKVMVRGTGINAIDSTTFGPLDMRDIVGRVTQIYFSRDGSTIRWQRMFTMVNP